ncbi:penicillin-binding protein 2 [Magnetospira sp. QH-2]|uniref:peptidoglycan D,D-transpeptidase FtsI family protein n=1 Tax=Magnetospira sp. (strain QH-2) TaxID=1288970 RepID=UPI0003E819B1|nr:penicillin-binding protein 2 [Magnetospira sp. QH-2]CCQ72810.1 Putative peptidoglycan glycosyl transferase, Ftsi [Magnetospira sp. QH-2]
MTPPGQNWRNRFSGGLAGSAALEREGRRTTALQTGRSRLMVTGALFAIAFLVVAGRVAQLTLTDGAGESMAQHRPISKTSGAVTDRSAIVDRNGVVLASSLPTASVYADARKVLDPHSAALQLAKVLPDVNWRRLEQKLSSKRAFVWLHRNLTPKEQNDVNRLGIPGIFFQHAERRVYPHGRLAAHVLGMTDIDGRGIAGVERYFDEVLRTGEDPLELSIDIRVQSMLHDSLYRSMKEFKGIGAAGLVMDARSGEVLAMVSLPDYDPNAPMESASETRFNRVTKGVYEMGSTFKLFTAAMALDTNTVKMTSGYDASEPIRVARFTIRDFHAENRWLTVPEIMVHSSNIGAAKMALDVGTTSQKEYLGRLGLLDKPSIELPEIASPLVPRTWRDINTMTISYGHGIAVTPLQLASGVAALVNGGETRPATLMKTVGDAALTGKRVMSKKTSRQVRQLMRMVVEQGTGRNADVPGYLVGGKTGTAEKQQGKKYNRNARLASFVGAFPLDDPRFVILAMVDEPKGLKRTFGYATGGWVAAPVVKEMVRNLATLYGIAPDPALIEEMESNKGKGHRLASF